MDQLWVSYPWYLGMKESFYVLFIEMLPHFKVIYSCSCKPYIYIYIFHISLWLFCPQRCFFATFSCECICIVRFVEAGTHGQNTVLYDLLLFVFSGKSITLLGKIKLAARLHRPHMFIGYPSNSTEIQRKPASLRAMWCWMVGKQKWMDCWWSVCVCVYERLICTLYPLRESTGIEGFRVWRKAEFIASINDFSHSRAHISP